MTRLVYSSYHSSLMDVAMTRLVYFSYSSLMDVVMTRLVYYSYHHPLMTILVYYNPFTTLIKHTIITSTTWNTTIVHYIHYSTSPLNTTLGRGGSRWYLNY